MGGGSLTVYISIAHLTLSQYSLCMDVTSLSRAVHWSCLQVYTYVHKYLS